MHKRWISELRERGELGSRMGPEIAAMLGKPDLTLDQTNRLFSAVNRHCQEIERLIEQLDNEAADDAILELAESVDAIWSTICEAVARRMSEMRKRHHVHTSTDELLRSPNGHGRSAMRDGQKIAHDFSTYSREAPPEIASRRYCRNHVEVAGLHIRRADAMLYVAGAVEADEAGEPHGLNLEREPDNPHDPNAIRVIGWWGSSRTFLGYVPKEYAECYARIADSGGRILAVPKRAYQGHDDFIEVRFVIYGIDP